MKLDRNTNRSGRGKYALVNMRKLIPILDDSDAGIATGPQHDIASAFKLLVTYGVVTLGNESPGDQFFVMKYKDRFTQKALFAYADAVRDEAISLRAHNPTNPQSDELDEYAAQMFKEAKQAKIQGFRIPD